VRLDAGDRVVHMGAHAVVISRPAGHYLRVYREPSPECWIGAAHAWSAT
jgi:hypothetical protein